MTYFYFTVTETNEGKVLRFSDGHVVRHTLPMSGQDLRDEPWAC